MCYSVTTCKSAFVTKVICNRHFHIPLHTLLYYPVTHNVCIYIIYINIVTSVTITRHCLKFNYLQVVTNFKNCYKTVTPVTQLINTDEKTLLYTQGHDKNKQQKHEYAHYQAVNKYTQLYRLWFILRLILTQTLIYKAIEDIF